ENNRRRSETITAREAQRILKRNADGTMAAWLEEGNLVIYRDGRLRDVALGSPGTAFNVSSGGEYVVVTVPKKDGCHPVIIRTSDLTMQSSPVALSCDDLPAVTGSDGTLYAVQKGALTAGRPTDAELTQKSNAASLAPKTLKILNRHIIVDLPDGSLLIFVGAAGQYRMYHYSGKGTARLASENVARPTVYMSDSTATKDRVLGVIYGGTSGRYVLQKLSGNPVALSGAIKASVSPSVFYDPDKDSIIGIENLQLTFTAGGTTTLLPIRARNFVVLHDTMVMEDLKGQVLSRPAQFSALELALVDLRKKAEAGKGAAKP
ncbi:MAG: hypothetical protein HY042_00850, partial [Spirochaetia bacterium]|nr:hypothetical protein [Spirochaetia bacterium]